MTNLPRCPLAIPSTLLFACLSLLGACDRPYPGDVVADGPAVDAAADAADGRPIDAPATARTIAFTSDRSGNNDIFTVRLDGTGLQNLTNDPAADSAPLWSPDGSRIAFLSNRTGTQELYVMLADGTGVTNVSRGQVDSFDWAPDGTRLVFDSGRTGSQELFRGTFDGSAPTQLTTLGGAAPRWSPDGQRLAFVNAGGIFVANSNGANANRVSMGTDTAPTWTPDSLNVVFSRRITFTNNDLMIVGADGSNLRNITNTTDTTESRPTVNPGGASVLCLGGTDLNRDIVRFNLDGTGVANLSMTAAIDADPRWSTDGQSVSFSSGGDIFATSASGGLLTNLTNHPATEGQAVWKPSL